MTTLYNYSGSGYANPHAATSIGGVAQSYDSNGNLISDGTWTHSWDYLGRLMQSQKTGTTVTYAYDQAGSRVKLVTPLKTTIVPTKFYSVEGTEAVKYITAGDASVATIRGTGQTATAQWMHVDNLNSPSSVSNLQGQLIQISDFLPFGAVRFEQNYNNFDDRKGYIGKDFDKDTQLSYLEARYYNGTTGRFTSQDRMFWELPAELLVDPQQQNSYSYGRNNPINRSDPSGELNIIIPGTNYDPNGWNKDGAAKDLFNNVANTFPSGKQTIIFNIKSLWSGQDNIKAREDGANNIARIINNRKFADGETLNIIGHSHGGNVAALLSHKLNRKIDNLVTLATPIRYGYDFKEDNIGKHINVYSNFDGIQRLGGGMFSVPSTLLGCFTLCKNSGGFLGWGEFGPALRKTNEAINLRVTKQVTNWPLSSHSEIWKNVNIWNEVRKEF